MVFDSSNANASNSPHLNSTASNSNSTLNSNEIKKATELGSPSSIDDDEFPIGVLIFVVCFCFVVSIVVLIVVRRRQQRQRKQSTNKVQHKEKAIENHQNQNKSESESTNGEELGNEKKSHGNGNYQRISEKELRQADTNYTNILGGKRWCFIYI